MSEEEKARANRERIAKGEAGKGYDKACGESKTAYNCNEDSSFFSRRRNEKKPPLDNDYDGGE